MKSVLIYLEPIQLDSFIWHCLCGNGRMVIHGKEGNKAVLDSGRYIVMKDGKYITSKKSQEAIKEIMKGLIEKYKKFEYDGNLYHSPEYSQWIKDEV